MENYLNLHLQYLKEGRNLLKDKNYNQAGEKYWGAVATLIKAVADKKGKKLMSHGEIWKFIKEIADEMKEEGIINLFGSANNLHQNYYEGWLPPEVVKKYAEDCEKLIDKLKKFYKLDENGENQNKN